MGEVQTRIRRGIPFQQVHKPVQFKSVQCLNRLGRLRRGGGMIYNSAEVLFQPFLREAVVSISGMDSTWCPPLDVDHLAFLLPTTAFATLQGAEKGGFGEALAADDMPRQRKRWEDSIREWTGQEFGKSQRAVENREKWGKVVAQSSVVPQRPWRSRDRWWWWWIFPNHLRIVPKWLEPVRLLCWSFWGPAKGLYASITY